MQTNSDILLLKILLNKDKFIKYQPLINNLELTKEIKLLINLINKYYEKFPNHLYVALDELEQFFLVSYPSIKEPELYKLIFEKLKTIEVSDSLTSEVVKQILSRDYATSLIDLLVPIADGTEDAEGLNAITELHQKYYQTIAAQEETANPFLIYTPDELFGFEEEVGGLDFPIEGLTEYLGCLPRRTLGHIFARVETGKTTLLSHCITHWASTLSSRGSEELVVGVFNEEGGRRVVGRTYHSLLNKTADELEAIRRAGKSQELLEYYNRMGGNNLRIYHDTEVSVNKIKELLEMFPIRALVIDIADHVQIGGKFNGVERLNALYRAFRQMADHYNVDIVTCGQASAECAGRSNLFLEHMYDSKTAKPGALDYAIGIGSRYDEPDRRWLCICKNKLKSVGYRVVDAMIDRAHGRYIGI